ncbi:MAG: ribosome assembly cofactor RimP [Treponema sp.]|nr:ribosome assembly cofactor RimP [Treponema sp.]
MAVRYKIREPDQDAAALIGELEPVIGGLGFALVELDLFRRRGSAQVRLVITGTGRIGTDELSRVHRAVLPRLELVLAGRDLYLEVSSPGTDRLIKEGAEFRHYTGRVLKCWRTGGDRWEQGLLHGSDEERILLDTEEGIQELRYETIAKARLDG